MCRLKVLFLVFAVVVVSVFSGSRLFAAGTAANTQIQNGGDAGSPNLADTAGDTIVQWLVGNTTSFAASNLAGVVVSTGFALTALPAPSDQTLLPGATANYAYSICNLGNATDTISLSTSVIAGATWPARIFRDDNADGIRQPTENTEISTTGTLAADATFYFFVSVVIPSNAVDGSTSTIRLTARNRNGSGTEDNWPAAGNDTRIDDTTTRSSVTTLQMVKGANRSTARPFTDPIVYTSTITATGSGTATNVIYRDKLPLQCDYITGSIVRCIWSTGGTRESISDGVAWNSGDQLITVNLGDLTAGTSAYVEFRVNVR